MSDFSQALAKTLIHEGGYVNNPVDHGGATNKGVTQKVYDDWRDFKEEDRQDVKLISDGEVADIYHEFYWKPCRCGELISQPIAEKVFDLAVNCGPRAAIRILQQACGDSGHLVMVDGAIGALTLQAANACNPHDLIDAIRSRAKDRYRRIVQNDPSQNIFLNGWLHRVDS